MTAPMPETMSPRDEVEYWLSLAMVAGLHKQDFSLTEAADAILAALASSDDQLSGNPGQLKSGDHAELADRLLNVSLRWDDADQEREEASRAITALIAEVAALRGEVETLTTAGIVEVAVRNPSVSDYVQHWEGRANEAERKLAEAVGLLEWARDELPEINPSNYDHDDACHLNANEQRRQLSAMADLPIKECARIMGVSPDTIRNARRKGLS